MLKHIEILVVDKSTGEIRHDIKKICNLDVPEDFNVWFLKVSEGFMRLIKKSSDDVITISCEDYKKTQQTFLDIF